MINVFDVVCFIPSVTWLPVNNGFNQRNIAHRMVVNIERSWVDAKNYARQETAEKLKGIGITGVEWYDLDVLPVEDYNQKYPKQTL